MKTGAAQKSPTWHAFAIRSADPEESRGNWLEHRWGPRRPCRARVSLSTSGGLTGFGRLRNVSISGAFLETTAPLPLFVPIAIAVVRDDESTHTLAFPAVVVRHDEGGVGIEWCDPSPSSVCNALDCGIDCAFKEAGPV